MIFLVLLFYGVLAYLLCWGTPGMRRQDRRIRRYREWEESMAAEERERAEREQLGFEIASEKSRPRACPGKTISISD